MGVGINSVGVMYTAAALLARSLRKKAMEKGGPAQSQPEEGINIVSEEWLQRVGGEGGEGEVRTEITEQRMHGKWIP